MTIAPQRSSKPLRKKEPDYPDGDGKPMAETIPHRKQMTYCCDTLEFRYRDRDDVHVSGNDFIYFEEGNPHAKVSPDCYVVFGVARKTLRERRSFFVWRERGKYPDVIIEITSKKTRRVDTQEKRPLYEQVMRVAEYFQFDPTGDYLTPRLKGQRLADGEYIDLELKDDRLYSEQLGLDLVIIGEYLRFYDPLQGKWLLSYEEEETERQEALQREEAERQRAEAAEAENARLLAELEALRRQQD